MNTALQNRIDQLQDEINIAESQLLSNLSKLNLGNLTNQLVTHIMSDNSTPAANPQASSLSKHIKSYDILSPVWQLALKIIKTFI